MTVGIGLTNHVDHAAMSRISQSAAVGQGDLHDSIPESAEPDRHH